MTSASAAVGVARERADDPPRRIAAGRAEWKKLAALTEWRAEWRELAGRALEPNVFYDPAFALAAAPVFGNPGAVLVWSKAGRLIGFFPARIERRYGVLATLTGWTHPYAPFGVPLVDRDEAEAAITAFLDHVETNEKLPKLALLPLVARDGPFAAALARVLARHGGAAASFADHARALLAPEGDRTSYLDHVAHKKLKELRRQRRRLEEAAPVTHDVARDAQEVAAALADFLGLEAAGWKGRQGGAAIEHPATAKFMHGAVTGLAADGHARIDRLMQGGRAIAATITLRSGANAWFWKIAYDEAHARSSPGVQLSVDLTDQLLADESLARVDSCATADHPMIDHLWRERLALTDLLIAPSRAALTQFRFARPLESLRRALISSAKRVRNLRTSS
jgi:CelD/BcsL family acetyltransferase involved in cellulose biosynthesis